MIVRRSFSNDDQDWPTEYVENFVTHDEEQELIFVLASMTYRQDSHRGKVLKRRQCDFGATYSPSGTIGTAPEIPNNLQAIRERVEDHCKAQFDQLIVTWYPPGAGIGRHTDAKWFGEPIAGLSLGGACVLTRRESAESSMSPIVKRELLPCSLYIMRDQERWYWQHEIQGKSVKLDRWSLTFRVLAKETHLYDALATSTETTGAMSRIGA